MNGERMKGGLSTPTPTREAGYLVLSVLGSGESGSVLMSATALKSAAIESGRMSNCTAGKMIRKIRTFLEYPVTPPVDAEASLRELQREEDDNDRRNGTFTAPSA